MLQLFTELWPCKRISRRAIYRRKLIFLIFTQYLVKIYHCHSWTAFAMSFFLRIKRWSNQTGGLRSPYKIRFRAFFHWALYVHAVCGSSVNKVLIMCHNLWVFFLHIKSTFTKAIAAQLLTCPLSSYQKLNKKSATSVQHQICWILHWAVYKMCVQ